MAISLKTHKILWGRSGNKCAICQNELIVDSSNSTEDPSIVGEEPHIIARKETFTRGDFDSTTQEQRDHYSNLILLCRNHHKQIDDQPEVFTVKRLHEIKSEHEAKVRSGWTKANLDTFRDELVYSEYIDKWQSFADLDNWMHMSSYLTDETSLPKIWYDNQKKFLIWFISRLWPDSNNSLENALINYRIVLEDFLREFDKHILYKSRDSDFLITERFYKIDVFEKERYSSLLLQYEEHVCLVNDLFFELTRAINYICDKVRDTLYKQYRIQEGATLIIRCMVGEDLRTEYLRLEYHNVERKEIPYPGIDIFKEVRYTTRDYALERIEPDLPPSENAGR